MRYGSARSAADLTHRSGRPVEGFAPHGGARPLWPRGRGDCLGEAIVTTGGLRTNNRTQVGFLEGEQAGSELALSRDSHAVAALAERFGDAGDDPNVSMSVAVAIALRRFDVGAGFVLFERK